MEQSQKEIDEKNTELHEISVPVARSSSGEDPLAKIGKKKRRSPFSKMFTSSGERILNVRDVFESDEEIDNAYWKKHEHSHESSGRDESSTLIDRSKSALGPAREQQLKKYIRYARHKAEHYTNAMFKYQTVTKIMTLSINFPVFFMSSGSAWQLITDGDRSNPFTWITFIVTTWILFWTVVREISDPEAKMHSYHRDATAFTLYARNWDYELSVGVDDRETKCEIEVRKAKGHLNQIDENARPLRIPPLNKKQDSCAIARSEK